METSRPDVGPPPLVAPPPGLDADAGLAELYRSHHLAMVRVAFLLTRDAGRAEELVQDAFVDLYGRWSRLRDPEAAVASLRQSVLNRARSSLRHLKVVRAHDARVTLRDVVSAESSALDRIRSETVLASLADLPSRGGRSGARAVVFTVVVR